MRVQVCVCGCHRYFPASLFFFVPRSTLWSHQRHAAYRGTTRGPLQFTPRATLCISQLGSLHKQANSKQVGWCGCGCRFLLCAVGASSARGTAHSCGQFRCDLRAVPGACRRHPSACLVASQSLAVRPRDSPAGIYADAAAASPPRTTHHAPRTTAIPEHLLHPPTLPALHTVASAVACTTATAHLWCPASVGYHHATARAFPRMMRWMLHS